MKQFLTIFAALIVLSGVGIAVYFLFFAHDAPRLQVGNTATSFSDAISKANIAMGTTTNATPAAGSAGTLVAPGLVEISSDPVSAGSAVFDVTTSAPSATMGSTSVIQTANADTAVHYIDRTSGNVYEYTVFGRTLTRIGNKTLPGIQQASWLRDGSMAFAQFLASTAGTEQVDTYALPAVGTSGYFLQQNLSQATVVGSSTIFTLAEDANSSVGTLADADGTHARTLFNTTLTNLSVFPAGSDYIAVPKAAQSLAGYAFAINNAGVFTPIIGPYNGLTVLPSPSGKFILFSYMDGSTLDMNVFDRTTGGVTKLPLATLTEKCTWTADSAALYCAVPLALTGTLPDDWYQGAVSFSDRIWRIDLQSRTASLVLNPADAKVTIDAVNLTIDPNGKAIVFRNKIDSSLWAFDL